MTGLFSLVKRNVKLYFKDKGMFFSSLLTPIILLVLYVTFLKKIYDDSFRSALKEAGVTVADSVINGCVGGQLVSSILAVSCVTVAFCSNLLMIKDKTSGAINDLTMAPIKRGTLGLGYYIATLVSTLIVNLTATAACLVYLAVSGWYLSAGDVFLIVGDVFLITLFGTAISSCVNFFLTTDGQASAVGTVVSAGYGFICGAYMPISQFDGWLQKILSLLPGTYGTSLIRNHSLRGVFDEMLGLGFPAEVVDKIKESVDCRFEFFGNNVSVNAMFWVMFISTAALIGVYVLINALAVKPKKN